MSAGQALLVIGVLFVIIAVVVAVMIRLGHDEADPDVAIMGFKREPLASPVDGSIGENVMTGMAGMNQHEREEFLLTYCSRKERKAIKDRRKAREQAQKPSNYPFEL